MTDEQGKATGHEFVVGDRWQERGISEDPWTVRVVNDEHQLVTFERRDGFSIEVYPLPTQLAKRVMERVVEPTSQAEEVVELIEMILDRGCDLEAIEIQARVVRAARLGGAS